MNFSTFSMTKGGSTATLVPPLPQPTTAGQSFNSFSNCGDHVEELPVPDFLAIGALSEISKLTCGKECVCLQRWAADHPEMFLDYSSRRNNFLTSTDSQSKRTEVSSARSTDGKSETAPTADYGSVSVRQASSKVFKSSKYNTVSGGSKATATTSSSSTTTSTQRTQDVESTSTSSQEAEFVAFAMEVATGMTDCCWKAVIFMSGRSLNFFFKRLNCLNNANRVDVLRKRVGAVIGKESAAQARTEAGLSAIASLSMMEHCCSNGCFAQMTERHADLLWTRWASAATQVGGDAKRRKILAELCWDEFHSCWREDICYEALRRLFGVSTKMVRNVKKKLLDNETATKMDSWTHGMADYMEEHGPPNKKLTECVQKMFDDLIEMYFRADPEEGKMFAVSADMTSVAAFQKKVNDILSGIVDEESSELSLSSGRRAMQSYAKRHGVKLCGMGVDHQLCPHCKFYTMMLRLLHLHRARLKEKLGWKNSLWVKSVKKKENS